MLRSDWREAMDEITTADDTHVVLEDHMGGDLSIVNAARVSFANHSTYEQHCGSPDDNCGMVYDDHGSPTPVHCTHDLPFHSRLSSRDSGLIRYLMEKHHGTPFEMVQLQFRVHAPIRVMREWQRHRIGSFNEVSTRYVEMMPEFFLPNQQDVRVQEGKPGHYIMVDASPEMAASVRQVMREAYASAWAHYQELIQSGVAKELAAYVLPLGTYSEQIWSVNLRSLFNFCALRTHPTALREIQHPAREVEGLAREACPVAFAAFDAVGRVVP